MSDSCFLSVLELCDYASRNVAASTLEPKLEVRNYDSIVDIENKLLLIILSQTWSIFTGVERKEAKFMF